MTWHMLPSTGTTPLTASHDLFPFYSIYTKGISQLMQLNRSLGRNSRIILFYYSSPAPRSSRRQHVRHIPRPDMRQVRLPSPPNPLLPPRLLDGLLHPRQLRRQRPHRTRRQLTPRNHPHLRPRRQHLRRRHVPALLGQSARKP